MSAGSHRRETEVAVAAARDAGAMLRDEFHRPGGPRGSGGHAEIDRPVEELIRSRLSTAFPDDGFLGEETGARDPAAAGGRRWIVDPNDGTREFLRGRRGPSVSIALVAGDRPVLGVVYAYTAPDDNGDLFVGLPGEGVFRGAGTAANPAAVDRSAAPAGYVAVSSSADGRPDRWAANVERCRPWTPRPVPGIAYRLALTAVGECRVATTLTAPWSWDMAGGHALLLAAGGDLVTRDGTPVRYDEHGACTPSTAYFGGRRDDVERIRARDWDALLVHRPGRW